MKFNHINTWFPLLLIATGLCLRLAWNSDMEWKDDEKLMFELANAAVAADQVPDIGMMSGGGVVNPGLSVAPFAFFAKFTNTPEGMNRMVQITNIVALLMYLAFVLKLV